MNPNYRQPHLPASSTATHLSVLLLVSILTVALCSCAPAESDESASQPPVEPGSRLAARLETMLSGMTETAYQATTEINEDTGSLKCDCSGLIGYVLSDQFPEAYLSLRGEEAPWRKRPVSVTFYETFADAASGTGNGRWQHVEKLKDVKPGDILAWRNKAIKKGQASGHTGMVASEPVVERDGRVRLRIIDSTRGPHSNDTRTEATLGVGTGDMYFIADSKGRPSGFYVRSDGPLSTDAFAFGRLVDLGDEAAPGYDDPVDADFVGLRLKAAEALAAKRQIEARVIEEDGHITPVPFPHNNQRINFVVRNGKVIRVLRG